MTQAEIERLTTWPSDIGRSDLSAFFHLSDTDLRWLRKHRVAENRIGLATQLCALRYLGTFPEPLADAPVAVVALLCHQLDATPDDFDNYETGVDVRTRRRHVESVLAHGKWTVCDGGQWKRLGDWLVERALEHDIPAVLFRSAVDFLHSERIVRPGLDRLNRAIGAARAEADAELHRRVQLQLTPTLRNALDDLVVTDPALGVAPLVWLGTQATTVSPAAISAEIAKLELLEAMHAGRVDMGAIAPERARHLASLGRRSTPLAIRRMAVERRYPILLASVAETHGSVIDEIVHLFDRALGTTESRTRHQVAVRKAEIVAADMGRLVLLDEILPVIIDSDLDDASVGRQLRYLGSDRLTDAVRGDDERLPRDGGHLGLIEARFSYMRQFMPKILAALEFSASVSPSEILEAVEILKRANTANQIRVPFDVPTGFVPTRWMPYLNDTREAADAVAFKHYWELCVLYALRAGLRSGEIWVKGSRRYANPATFLLTPDDWELARPEMLAITGQPTTFADRLDQIDTEYTQLLDDLEPLLAAGDGPIRIGPNGELNLSPLAAETLPDHIDPERKRLGNRLPMRPLPDILIEADQATGFSEHLTHANGATPRATPWNTNATCTQPCSRRPATSAPPDWLTSPA